MRSLFICPALLLAISSFAAESASLGKLAVAPDAFEGKEVQAEASMSMILAQAAASACKKKKKNKGVMLTPPIVDGKMGASGSVQYQACVPNADAADLADLEMGAQVTVTGTVRVKKTMGIIAAIVFDDAKIERRAEE